MSRLVADRERRDRAETGIYVRAMTEPEPSPKWESVDIAHLERASLIAWLDARPDLATNVVLALLGHEPRGASGR